MQATKLESVANVDNAKDKMKQESSQINESQHSEKDELYKEVVSLRHKVFTQGFVMDDMRQQIEKYEQRIKDKDAWLNKLEQSILENKQKYEIKIAEMTDVNRSHLTKIAELNEILSKGEQVTDLKAFVEQMNTTANEMKDELIKSEQVHQRKQSDLEILIKYSQIQNTDNVEAIAKWKRLYNETQAKCETLNSDLNDKISEIQKCKQRIHSLMEAEDKANKQMQALNLQHQTQQLHIDLIQSQLSLKEKENKQIKLSFFDINEKCQDAVDVFPKWKRHTLQTINSKMKEWKKLKQSQTKKINELHTQICGHIRDSEGKDIRLCALERRVTDQYENIGEIDRQIESLQEMISRNEAGDLVILKQKIMLNFDTVTLYSYISFFLYKNDYHPQED